MKLSKRTIIREQIKDVFNSIRLKQSKCHFYYIHVPKTGGTGLRDFLSSCCNAYVRDWHELKLCHLHPRQKAIISVRDPISRFESAFYHKLHQKQLLSQQEHEFYELYPTVNSLAEALACEPHATQTRLSSYSEIPMFNRYFSIAYWLRSPRCMFSRHIAHVIRLEFLEHDLYNFLEAESLTELIGLYKPARKKPSSQFEPLNDDNRAFLSAYLAREYCLLNELMAMKGLPLYSNSWHLPG